jgi:EAL domain-containing protein (putative c-di-GMP-specific phosphodiesterase class I)
VETAERRDFLSATMTGAAAQSFYFSRPMPAAETAEALRRGMLRAVAEAAAATELA